MPRSILMYTVAVLNNAINNNAVRLCSDAHSFSAVGFVFAIYY